VSEVLPADCSGLTQILQGPKELRFEGRQNSLAEVPQVWMISQAAGQNLRFSHKETERTVSTQNVD
jgi:hypothetical protein